MDNRLEYFYVLRGIAISMVVAIHTFSYAYGESATFIRQLFNCAVPLFLAISAYFISTKKVDSLDSYKKFISKQVPKVYIPAIIWSFPLFFRALFTTDSFMREFILLLTCGHSVYYFIILIIQYYLLLPLLKECRNIKWGGVTLCVSILCVGLVHFARIRYRIEIPFLLYAAPFPMWIAFFVEGIIIRNIVNRNYGIILILIGVLLMWVLQYIESGWLLKFATGGAGIKPSSFLFSYLVILLLFSHKAENFFQKAKFISVLFIKIGNLSFGIYLTHCYIINILHIMPFSFLQDNWFIKWLVVMIITYAIIWLGQMALPPKMAKHLGFYYDKPTVKI